MQAAGSPGWDAFAKPKPTMRYTRQTHIGLEDPAACQKGDEVAHVDNGPATPFVDTHAMH